MEQAFDNDYYDRKDIDGKPIWDDDIDLGDITMDEDDAGPPNMDADFEPGGDAYDPLAPAAKGSKRQKQREKKKNKKRKVVDAALDEADPEEEVSAEEQKRRLGAAVEEYRKMEYEDIVRSLCLLLSDHS